MTETPNDSTGEKADQARDADAEVSPADEERVERLIRGLTEAPAIKCPLTFKWRGTQDMADNVSIKIRLYGLMMREDSPSMAFEALKGITFHHDYEQALKEVAGTDRSAPVPTNEAGGFSVGMMVCVTDGVHLVMHESVALALASDDRTQSDWAQHIVRHELCHVDDFAFKQSLIEKHPDKCSYSGFDSLMAPLAETMWSEFYANAYSTGPWSDPRMSLDLLRDSVPAVRAEIIDAILDYRNHEDLDRLLSIVKPKVKFVAQCFGYASGTVAAFGTPLEQQAPEEHATLQRLGLLNAWDECYKALNGLDHERPGWESALKLKKLFPGCVALFSGFGLHYRPEGEGAFVEIPSTPETSLERAMLRRLGWRG